MLGPYTPPPRTGKLQLDLLGSTVWTMLDGQTPLRKLRRHSPGTSTGTGGGGIAVTQFVRGICWRGLVGLR
jgi:hypothetical protein